MTNDLVPIFDLPPISAPDVQDAQTFSRLPYISLVQASSGLASPPHQIRAGTFVLHTNKTTFESLGNSFDVYVCDFKYKATRYEDKKFTVSTDKNSNLYKDIEDLALNGDRAQKKANKVGVEFLLYICSTGQYCTYFFNSPTLRNCAPLLAKYARCLAVIMSDPIKTEEFSWWGLAITACTERPAIPLVEAELRSKIMEFTRVRTEEVEEEDVPTEQLER